MSTDTHQNPAFYLLGAQLKKNSEIMPGTVKPIANTFMALKTDASQVVSDIQFNASGQQEVVNTVKDSSQVYLSDENGEIKNFEVGIKKKANLEKVLPFLPGTKTAVFPKNSQLLFPPQNLVMHHLLVDGYESWVEELRKNIDDIAKLDGAGFNLKDDTSYETLSVKDYFEPATSKHSSEYQAWHEKNKSANVVGLVVPQTKAIVILFSNIDFEDSTVAIFDRHGNAVFSTKPYVDDTFSRIQEIKILTGSKAGACAAIFYDPLNEFNKAKSYEDQVYRIQVELDDEVKDTLKFKNKTYSLVERIRFPITNLAGEFEVLNGDPISLEEAMIKQFPSSYGDLLAKLKTSDAPHQLSTDIKTQDPGFASVINGIQTANNTLNTAAGVLGADGGFLAARAIGQILFDMSGQAKELKIGNVTAAETLNIVFGVYDKSKKIAKMIEGLREKGNNGLGILNAADKISDLKEAFDDTKVGKFVTDLNSRIPSGAPIFDINNIVPINDRYKSIIKKTNGYFSKVGDVVGMVGDGLAVASAVEGMSKNMDNVGASKSRYEDILKRYAHGTYVASARPKDAKQATAMEPKLQAVMAQYAKLVKKNGLGNEELNVTFQFDRSQFKPDEDFNSFVELIKILPADTVVTLIGHTCDIGSSEYNMSLSIRRAHAVQQVLLKAGLDAARVKVQGRGQSEPEYNNSLGESERSKNRRVVASVPMAVDFQYYPSREGMAILERARAIYTSNFAGQDEAARKVLVACIDAVMGLPITNPAHAISALVWLAGKTLYDLSQYSDKLIFGEHFLNSLKQQDDADLLSAANQTLLLIGQSKTDGRNGDDQLNEQYRLRTEALVGLHKLLLRCAIENGSFTDDIRDGGNLISYADTRTTFDFNSNVTHYRVEEYINAYILSDAWALSCKPIFPVSLDEQWIQQIESGLLDKPVQSPDPSLIDTLTNAVKQHFSKGFDLTDLASPVFLLSEDARQLKKQAIKGMMTSPLLMGQYVGNNVAAIVEGNKAAVTKANFQKVFPVHYMGSSSYEALTQTLKPIKDSLDDEIYLGTCIHYREPGETGSSGWKMVKNNSVLGPYHQVRICILLKPDNDDIKKLLTGNPSMLTYLPVEVAPVRLDGFNLTGPATKSFISKIKMDDLLADEKALLPKDADDDYLGKLHGAIINPFYMFGANQIFGTKPMAGAYSSWLNTDGDKIDSLYNWNAPWEMDYGFEVKVANQADTKIFVESKEGADEFTLAIDAEKSYTITGPNGIKQEIGEQQIIDRDFLAIQKGRAEYPPLFEGAQAFCMMRSMGVENSSIFFPSKLWDEDVTLAKNNRNEVYDDLADVKDFKWNRPVELTILVVCDNIKKDAYIKQKMNWRSIPASIQLRKLGIFSEIDGPAYDTSLKYLGKIQETDDNVKLVWEKNEGKNLPSKLKFLRDKLSRETSSEKMDKKRLARLKLFSGLDAKDSDLTNLIEKWLPEKPKYVYAATIKLDYQTVTGMVHEGLKPFATKSQDTKDDWILSAKLTTTGKSGFSEYDLKGRYKLPYPQGFNDPKAHWYIPNRKEQDYKNAILEADEDIEINKQIAANNNAFSDTEFRNPLKPVGPLVPWRLLDKESPIFWSDKRRKFVDEWLQDQNTLRFLPSNDIGVFASQQELVDEANS
jgi:outer membrane protein OmpA-like peptidoglycan-associated protein